MLPHAFSQLKSLYAFVYILVNSLCDTFATYFHRISLVLHKHRCIKFYYGVRCQVNCNVGHVNPSAKQPTRSSKSTTRTTVCRRNSFAFSLLPPITNKTLRDILLTIPLNSFSNRERGKILCRLQILQVNFLKYVEGKARSNANLCFPWINKKIFPCQRNWRTVCRWTTLSVCVCLGSPQQGISGEVALECWALRMYLLLETKVTPSQALAQRFALPKV